MRKITRKILFLTTIFLFVFLTPLIIFYCRGYRIDFNQKRIVKTGGLYIRANPKSSKIFIDGVLKKKTDFFFGASFVDNLLPKDYEVEIKKKGYQDWKKKLKVKESEVTEARNIFLIPEKPSLDLLSQNTQNFWISPNEKKIVLKEAASDEEKTGWILKLYDIDTDIKSHLFGENEVLTKIGRPEENLEEYEENKIAPLELTWSLDSKRFILKIGEIPVLVSLEQDHSSITDLRFLEETENIYPHPDNSNEIFFLKENKDHSLALLKSNIDSQKSENVLQGIIAFCISKKGIYYLDTQGNLQTSDFNGNIQDLSSSPFQTKNTAEYQIYAFDSLIFLQENNTFYLLSESGVLEKIISDSEFLTFSPDRKKICFWSSHEIKIVFLEEERSQPIRKKEEELFLIRFSEKINNLSWWNNHYLVLSSPSKIKVIEIDDREKVQAWDLIQFENPKIYYHQKNKEIYILSQENLFVSRSF